MRKTHFYRSTRFLSNRKNQVIMKIWKKKTRKDPYSALSELWTLQAAAFEVSYCSPSVSLFNAVSSITVKRNNISPVPLFTLILHSTENLDFKIPHSFPKHRANYLGQMTDHTT